MEIVDSLLAVSPIVSQQWSSNEYDHSFKTLFEEMAQSTNLGPRSQTALNYVIMASILSWTPQSGSVFADSLVKVYFSNTLDGCLKFFHLMFDTTKNQWEMKIHFFLTSERTKLENLVHEQEFATLVTLSAEIMHRNVDEASNFVKKALETPAIIKFHNNENIITVEHILESVKIFSLMAESNSMLTSYEIQEFDPLIIDLKQEEFNSIFTNMEEVNQNILIKKLNEKILLISDMLHDENILTQYYMDILHGIVLNFMEEYSIRIDRPSNSDIVLGTSNALLESSTSPLYLRYGKPQDNVITSYNQRPGWNSKSEECRYVIIDSSSIRDLKIRTSFKNVPLYKRAETPTFVHYFLDNLHEQTSPYFYENAQTFATEKFEEIAAINKNSDVYLPEYILGELLCIDSYDGRKLDKFVFKSLYKQEKYIRKQVTFIFGQESTTKKVILNIFEYDQIPNIYPQTILPDQQYVSEAKIYEMHILSNSAFRRLNPKTSILSIYSKKFTPRMTRIRGPSIFLNDLFKDYDLETRILESPVVAMQNMLFKLRSFWALDSEPAARMQSVVRGMLSANLDNRYVIPLKADPSCIYIPPRKDDQQGVLFKITASEGKKNTKEHLTVIDHLKDYIENNGLKNSIKPRVATLHISKNVAKFSALQTRDIDKCIVHTLRKKRSSEACYELTEEVLEESRLDENFDKERFAEKFVSFKKLGSKSQKEHFKTIVKSKHFEKATIWSNRLMQVQMGMSLAGSLFNGDEQGVAFNIGFIEGSVFLSIAGDFAKEYGVAFRYIGLTAMQKFLGSVMTASGPMLARMPSALIIFDLYQHWQAFQSGDIGAIVGVIGDGIAVATDAMALTLEILAGLDVISAVSWPGAPVAALLLLGVNIYDSVRTTKHINQIVPLTDGETAGEFFRALFQIYPEKHLQDLLDEKSMNDHMMEDLADRFKCSKDIGFYSQPSQKSFKTTCTKKKVTTYNTYPALGVYVDEVEDKCNYKVFAVEDNYADFRVKKVMNSRTFPKSLKNVESVCSNSSSLTQSSQDVAKIMFECHDMLSVKLNDSLSNISIIEVGSGRDIIYAFENQTNLITMSYGNKLIYGGREADSFVLYGNRPVTGVLDGREGFNELKLTSYDLPGSLTFQVLNEGSKIRMQNNCKKCLKNAPLDLINLKRIVGRVDKQETLYADCQLEEIDLKGGVDMISEDKIIIEDYENCTRNLIVYVNGSFHVENNARTGNFKYVINGGHLNQNLIFRADSNATNVVFFNCSLEDLFDIRAYQIKDDGAKNTWIKGVNFVYRGDSISDLLFKPKTNFFLNGSTSVLHFVLKDNITLTYTRSMLIGYKKTMEESVESLIEKYASLGNRLQIHLIIDSRDKKVFIGHGNVKNVSINDLHKNDLENKLPPVNILTNDFSTESHLVAADSENVFLIQANCSSEFFNFTCQMSRVYIYYFPGMKNSTLDFSPIASKHLNRSATFNLKILQEKSGVSLILSTSSSNFEDMFGLVSLINFPIDDVTDTLTIRTSKLLKINVQKHTFFTPPVRYNNKTEVVIITPKDDIDHVIIDHSINDTAFLKCNQSLMVTSNVGHKENRYDATTESTPLVTVILLKYFEVSEAQKLIYNGLKIEFVNKSFVLIDELDRNQKMFDAC